MNGEGARLLSRKRESGTYSLDKLSAPKKCNDFGVYQMRSIFDSEIPKKDSEHLWQKTPRNAADFR